MLDAYTVRKAIPRLVIAVVAINISIYLCVAALDIATIVGKGLNQLLVTPFVNSTTFEGIVETNTEGSIVGLAGAGALGGLIALIFATPGTAALAAAGGIEILGLLLPLVITVALMALAVLFTLVIWQALVIFLTVISPIAIACYVLPGTEKYFRQWWDLFLRTLVVFPMIAVFFAMSNVMAAILFNTASNSPDGIGILQYFATIVVVFAPLVLIPFAFKLSGGLISQVAQFAGGQASGLSRRAGQAVRQSRKDPNSWLGNASLRSRSARAEKGLTTRGLLARVPAPGRSQRISNATALDQFQVDEISKATDRYKMSMQDSDVMQSLVMTKGQVVADRAKLATEMEAATQKHASGNMTDEEFVAERTKINRQLAAHDRADMTGRTDSMRREAFYNPDRLKFLDAEGETGYNQMLTEARDIFGDDESVAEAMNRGQAVAAGVGRTDLAGNLYGGIYNPTRGAGKASAGQILAGHSKGVSGNIDELMKVASNPTYKVEEREKAVRMLADLRANAASPYGGNGENKAIVNSYASKIDQAFKDFASTSSTELHKDLTVPTGKQISQETTQVPSPTGPRSTTGTTIGEKRTLTGADAAYERLQQLSGQAVDPAVAAQQQGQQQGGQQGGQQQGGQQGGNP